MRKLLAALLTLLPFIALAQNSSGPPTPNGYTIQGTEAFPFISGTAPVGSAQMNDIKNFVGSNFPPGSNVSSGIVTPSGGSATRTLAAITADYVNILAFTGVDNTGATDSATGIQSAVTQACANPVHAVYIPPGTYAFSTRVLVPANCPNLVIRADPGTATWLAQTGNTSTQATFIRALNQTGLTISGIIFDGNLSGGRTTAGSLLEVAAPSSRIVIEKNIFQDANDIGLTLGQGAQISGNLSAQASSGQAVLTFSATPAGVNVGAYLANSYVEPETYVTALDSTTVTVNHNLTGGIVSGIAIHFTPAFQTSADVNVGTTTYPTASTTNLAVGQTIKMGGGNCIVPNTKITAVVTNTSVTVDTAPTCTVSSGSNIAAMAGVSEVTVSGNKFDGMGQGLRNTGTLALTTNGSTANGTTTLVLNCFSASCNPGVGVIPGDMTGASPPTGMPANNLVIGGPTVNTGAGTLTVTMANPTTGTINNGTSITFAVGQSSGSGYGVWFAQGAAFANRNVTFKGNTFRHTWSSPILIQNIDELLFDGNTYDEGWLEFQAVNVAPSACVALGFSTHVRFVGERCSGATGTGIEGLVNVDVQIVDSSYTFNGITGVSFCGGSSLSISGNFNNNGQYHNHALIRQNLDSGTIGIALAGNCTGNISGTISNVTIGNAVSGDDQASPTQDYGIARSIVAAGSVSNLSINNLQGSGNVISLNNLTGYSSNASATSTYLTNTSGTISQASGATFLALELWGAGGTGGSGPSLAGAASGSGGAGGAGGGHLIWGPKPWSQLGATSCSYSIPATAAAASNGSSATVTCNSIIVAQAGGGGGGGNGSNAANSGGGGGGAASGSGSGGSTTAGGGTGGTGGGAGGAAANGTVGIGDGGSGGAGGAAAGTAFNGGAAGAAGSGGGSGGGCASGVVVTGGNGGFNLAHSAAGAGVGGATITNSGGNGGGGATSVTGGTATTAGAGGFPGGGGGGGGAGCNGTGTGGLGGAGGGGQIIASQW